METTKKLGVKLKSGLLTELQSDTIMGHVCWRMIEQLGEEKLNEFISLYSNNKPVFTISNGLLEKNNILFFPKPYLNNSSIEKIHTKKERVLNFLRMKDEKSREFITLEQLNLFLSGDKDTYLKSFELPDIKDLSYPKLTYDLRVSVEIDRQKLSSKESQLFSYNPLYVKDSNETSFVIFIKIIDEVKYNEYKCEEILKSVFDIGYGKKKSSGYGQFEVSEPEPFSGFNEPENSNGFVTLGNYLPSQSDNLIDGFYEFNVKYGKLGEQLSKSENPFKQPIILFKPGSCFVTNRSKDFYGRITNKGEISEVNNFAVQFGMPFTLNFN